MKATFGTTKLFVPHGVSKGAKNKSLRMGITRPLAY
jgi:hypothetical protein